MSAPRKAHKDSSNTAVGLISQVADELWEVKDRKIKNLTKEDITIVHYKKMLVKNSTYTLSISTSNANLHRAPRSSRAREGEAV